MTSGNFKNDLFEQFARVGKALSNGNQLQLLEFLAQGEHGVEELANVAGLTIGNASQHLHQLQKVGLVESRKEGVHVYYRLSGEDVIELMAVLRAVGERHLLEIKRLVQTYLTTRDQLEPVSRQELLKRADDGIVTILDLRPRKEFDAGHLPGAINIPLNELEQHLDEINIEQEIVAYCRGPHCILAFSAVDKLRRYGFTAHRLEDGFPEWKLYGLPVETSHQYFITLSV